MTGPPKIKEVSMKDRKKHQKSNCPTDACENLCSVDTCVNIPACQWEWKQSIAYCVDGVDGGKKQCCQNSCTNANGACSTP